MAKIEQFTEEYSKKRVQRQGITFKDFLNSKNLILLSSRIILGYNSYFRKPLDLNENRYWNTTVGRKHPYWKTKKLPTPTKKLNK